VVEVAGTSEADIAEVPGRPPLVRTAPDRCELVAFLEDVRRLRLEVDRLVVSLHWGVAGDYVCEYQRTIAHAAIDAGADVIAGHGPHSVHGVEVHQGRPILYSLGNLVFDWPTMRGRHRDGLVAVLTIANKQLTGVTLHLVQRDEGNDVRLVSLTEPAGAALLDRLTALSRQLGSSLSAPEGRVVVAGIR
jgi:poly-gamma-glutamate synthesis protein (capsule biosynthesis protein)